MSENTDKKPTAVELAKAQIKKQEEDAKAVHGAVNYAFITLDQPRGWKGFILKGVVNGGITATCVITGLAVRDHIKARQEGKLLTLNKTAPNIRAVQ